MHGLNDVKENPEEEPKMGSNTNKSDGKYRIRLDELPSCVFEIPESPMGSLGDIPVAYAVFQVDADDGADRARYTYYLYANDEYCRLAGCKLEDIRGVSHLEVSNSEDSMWSIDCYQAAYCGKTTSGIAYSPLIESWVCYNFAPAALEKCCTCAFIPINEEQRTKQMSIDERTSVVISELITTLAGEKSYEAAMQDMLEKTAHITHAERVIVFECYGPYTKTTFEWCAEGATPQLGLITELSSEGLKTWFKSTVDKPVALVPDTDRLARFSLPLYEWCVELGIKRLMAAPFYSEGEIVGFLGAYNYQLDETVDINRVFSEIRSFVGARIDNRRLIESLDWAGKHDALTSLLNRRGFPFALTEARAGREKETVAVALIDLDDFKLINDQYGHACGDEAICALAKFLTEVFPEDALLCRTGGDEFLVCLVGENADRVKEFIDGFRKTDLEFEYAGKRHNLSASIGYSQHPGASFDFTEAFAQADRALYVEKGKNKSR